MQLQIAANQQFYIATWQIETRNTLDLPGDSAFCQILLVVISDKSDTCMYVCSVLVAAIHKS